ncbi:MAG: BatD family protein [Gemmatimonadota bacterium]
MVALALALSLWQGAPTLTASVDRDHVAVGDEVVLTIRATSRSVDPLQVSLGPTTGFEVVGRSEQTEVSSIGVTSRTTTLEIRLRAIRPGKWPLGPVRARQGAQQLQTGALDVSVSSAAATATVAALSPRVKRVLERAPPPSKPGSAALTVLTSADTVYVGEQVDVVTAAWFPRDLRSQLRRAPTLQPPTAEGVWSYPQPVPPGIAASRKVRGTWYDLFVLHQVVFPLVPGPLRISKASLRYSVPVALQFFSQEERFTLESNQLTLAVVALPAAGKPADFSGAVGRGLSIGRTIAPPAGRAGEALNVDVAVSGRGNVALWPTPPLVWPAGLRAYTDRVDDQLEPSQGLLGGTKTFRNLAVPDSAGVLLLPAINYSFFDLDAHAYRVARVPAATITVAPAPEAATARALPPPLMSPRPAIALRIGAAVPAWMWVILILLPPTAAAASTIARRRRHPRAALPPADPSGADRRLQAALRALVPDVDRLSGPALAAALRAAGVDAAIAARVAQAREAYLASRYGPGADGRSVAEVARELDELTAALGATSRRGPRRATAAALALLLMALPLHSQTSPEDLYRSGSLRAATEAFARRTHAEPEIGAHWYNLGAAYYRVGAEGRASAAWLRAARLAPRASSVRRARALLPPPDDESERRAWAAPFTPEELALAALICWVVGWSFVIAGGGRFRRARVVATLGPALVLGLGAAALHRWYVRPLAVMADAGVMRLSPYGRAPEVAPVEAGAVVRPIRADGGWRLVQGPDGRAGWVPADALAMVTE